MPKCTQLCLFLAMGQMENTRSTPPNCMTFIIENSPGVAATLAGSGEDLRYGGISPSVAVEFDTFQIWVDTP